MDLNSAVFQALALALGLDPADPEASRRIRRAYVSPSPPPPPADRDTLYYHLMPDGSVRPLEESETCEGFPCFFRFAPYRLLLTFYGPSAESLAWGCTTVCIWTDIGRPAGRSAPRESIPSPILPDRSSSLRSGKRSTGPAWT